MLQSGQGSDGAIDIRDVSVPIQTPIIYVQSVEVELLLSRISVSTRLPRDLRQCGIFVENEAQCERRVRIDHACIPLIIEALESFFRPGFGPGLPYIRQRMFQAHRLSDLAPGVFVPQFSRDLHARQKLIAPLCRVLNESEGLAGAEPADSLTLPGMESSRSAMPGLESQIWNCMVYTLRPPRKSTQNSQIPSSRERTEKQLSATKTSSVEGSGLPAQLLGINEGPRHSVIQTAHNASTNCNVAHNEHQTMLLPDVEPSVSFGSSISDRASCQLFDWDVRDSHYPQYADDELLLHSHTADENTAADILLLETEMELCHAQGEGYYSSEAERGSHVLNQQLAYLEMGNRSDDLTDFQDPEILIGQDSITHRSSHSSPSYGDRFCRAEDHAHIAGDLPYFDWLADTASDLTNKNYYHGCSSIFDCHDSSPSILQLSSRKPDFVTDPAMFDTTNTSQRRESVTPHYTGKWNFCKSKKAPVINVQGRDMTPSRSGSVKSLTSMSPWSDRTLASDEMLFESFTFNRSTPRSSPRSRSENDEMLLDSPDHASTAPNSGASSPLLQPRRKSSVLRRLKAESETWSMSDNDEMAFQQTNPTGDAQIKDRERLNRSHTKSSK